MYQSNSGDETGYEKLSEYIHSCIDRYCPTPACKQIVSRHTVYKSSLKVSNPDTSRNLRIPNFPTTSSRYIGPMDMFLVYLTIWHVSYCILCSVKIQMTFVWFPLSNDNFSKFWIPYVRYIITLKSPVLVSFSGNGSWDFPVLSQCKLKTIFISSKIPQCIQEEKKKTKAIPDFNKLHQKWQRQLEIGKICRKKPQTVVSFLLIRKCFIPRISDNVLFKAWLSVCVHFWIMVMIF